MKESLSSKLTLEKGMSVTDAIAELSDVIGMNDEQLKTSIPFLQKKTGSVSFHDKGDNKLLVAHNTDIDAMIDGGSNKTSTALITQMPSGTFIIDCREDQEWDHVDPNYS